jgi:hypothetical protein
VGASTAVLQKVIIPAGFHYLLLCVCVCVCVFLAILFYSQSGDDPPTGRFSQIWLQEKPEIKKLKKNILLHFWLPT